MNKKFALILNVLFVMHMHAMDECKHDDSRTSELATGLLSGGAGLIFTGIVTMGLIAFYRSCCCTNSDSKDKESLISKNIQSTIDSHQSNNSKAICLKRAGCTLGIMQILAGIVLLAIGGMQPDAQQPRYCPR